MAIKVALVPNPIQQDGSVMPRVVEANRTSFDKLLDYMRMDTALEKRDLESALHRFSDALLY
jgi:hypothetical protein